MTSLADAHQDAVRRPLRAGKAVAGRGGDAGIGLQTHQERPQRRR
jgi:hypothetical protein